ncbi:pyridoxamine 5-phosphate oxidase [Spongiactinospora gelatinilytica]|uniref:Pyridoxamine 5-phosphate oxidase n=1 Tax=Spongiactinospora gelatinilytica TaxID=2666298 RepID=A0A2W2GW51_9ACTN|nr:pyridoxamine 5'-phosphate oxidase family protein [Spongiactinospora gelatinilytica]PZG51933.1 pyridoxamine 5-phosphate oxidase [Spongiactinospora gelatinilytica]
MAGWGEFAESAPEFAARARESFESHKHKTIATLRKDGSPRISGIEADIVGADLWFGSMPGALKARDLQRDPRFALHGPPVLLDADDPATTVGDVKLSGRAIEITDPERIASMWAARGIAPDAFEGSHFFTADIDEVAVIRIEGDEMVIDLWRPGHPLHRVRRT